jgi:hypothetical protein
MVNCDLPTVRFYNKKSVLRTRDKRLAIEEGGGGALVAGR